MKNSGQQKGHGLVVAVIIVAIIVIIAYIALNRMFFS
jgi:hypothetical protein